MLRTSNSEGAFLEHLVNAVARRFAKPSGNLPSVQCASRTVLVRELMSARDELQFPGFGRVAGTHLLDQMVRTGLFRPLPIEPLLRGSRYELLAVGLSDDLEVISPAEILMALAPKGVICYFTAVHLHGLSTQVPPFHHVAELVQRTPSEDKTSSGQEKAEHFSHTRNPLGTRIFRYRDQDYYISRRSRSRVLACQQMIQGNRALVRITSLEQTLVDCLARPNACGGPPTVFEAWDEGSKLIDEDALAVLLERPEDATLGKRVGYMLENLVTPSRSARLGHVLDDCRLRPLHSPVFPSLLPGIDYEKVSYRWQLRVP